MKVVVLTGSELRHTFIRKAIALDEEIDVVTSYCEGQEKSLVSQVLKKHEENDEQLQHLEARANSERDFFGAFVTLSPDYSQPQYIAKGSINDKVNVQKIIDLQPDLLIAYGCSIIKAPLLEAFKGRFVNIHLGLSPYYRGSGTNFWPLVNNEVDRVGVTFMHIDEGVDTGKIIHQIRAEVCRGDTPHQIGNRLIAHTASVIRKLMVHFEELEEMEQLPALENEKYYKNGDFTEEAVVQLYKNFSDGLVEKYLGMAEEKKVRLIEQPLLKGADV